MEQEQAGRLIVVSNRLPLTARFAAGRWRSETSSGGLVAAVGDMMRSRDALWVGWPGELPPDDPQGRQRLLADWRRRHRLVPVDLPVEISRAFYEGYANDTLWPLLHGFPTRVVFDPGTWRAYVDANQRFADTVVAHAQPSDLIWVHDYQLFLVPAMVRAALPDARIGFFLHIPFPSSELFGIVPQRTPLLEGLLGSDLIAFQTHAHLHNFRRALLLWLGMDSSMDGVSVEDRTARLMALPIGAAGVEWQQLTEEPQVRRRVEEFRRRHRARRSILSVDRLDYTKGIPERLRAYRRLLRTQPERQGRVTLIQVAVPTREHVPAYQELRREVGELVGDIVGEFATPEWNPIVYLRRSVPRRELAALYAVADVAWVSPLRDGMNLVAKEYVICQGGRNGVLVVSEFAGAAQEMAEAIRVNPYDEEQSAEAIARALDLPDDERSDRMAALFERVNRSDARTWARTFVAALIDAVAARRGAGAVASARLPVAELVRAFRDAPSRMICVDYDGTLVPIRQRPQDARPGPDLLDLLRSVADIPRTTPLLVSGRAREDLDRWLGSLEGWCFAAEHGAYLRMPGADAWTALYPGAQAAWKAQVRPVLEHFLDRMPGSRIEEKSLSLAWHYRQVDPEFGEWAAKELADALHAQLAGTDLSVLLGNKVVEVRHAWATKGEALASVSARVGDPALVIAIGDDRTDEDMFARLRPEDWSIRVGGQPTSARHRLHDPGEVRALLALLAGGDEPQGVGR